MNGTTDLENQNFPYDWQIEMLGLAGRIPNLKGENVLDAGCGREANLVYHLRKQGINAEGIDIMAPNDDGFLRQNITNIYPWEGSIMRSDNEYSAVFANSMNELTHAFSDQEEASRNFITELGVGALLRFETNLEKIKKRAPLIILEILRVLKPGGYFISSPDLNKLEEKMGDQLTGCRIVREPVKFALELEKEVAADPAARKIFDSFQYCPENGVFPNFLKNRLVIYKE
jgi:SAM-dependent methyltransferase